MTDASGRRPTAPVPTVEPVARRARLWPPRKVPARIGRARTSTLLLVVLFVGFFALWVGVRPENTAGETSVPAGSTTEQAPAPATTEAPVPTSEPAPTTTVAPTTTTSRPTTTAPTTTGPADEPTPTTTSAPDTTTPAPTSTRPAPATTTQAPTSAADPTG